MKLPKHMTAYNVKNKSDGFIIKNNSTGKCLFTSSVHEQSVKLVVDDLNFGHGWNYEINKHLFGDVYHFPVEINHKELLKKYIAHVVRYEGTDFLDKIEYGYGGSDKEFTPEEAEELERLS